MAPVKREAQKRRTRRAIVAAAAELLREGQTPSIAQIAAAADVSRRTVYMYFPTLEQLLADAALEEVVRDTIEPRLDRSDDVARRLDSMVRALQSNALATERLGRTIIRHTVAPRDGDAATLTPRRGYRRVEWIESALEPARERLGEERFQLLVSALTLVVGWEAVLVLRDTRALSPDEAEDVSAWAAAALLAAALAELDPK